MKKDELYFEFLAEEGYRPSRFEDGDIGFRREGKQYVLFTEEDDPQFFRLAALYVWPIENEDERVQALHAATAVTSQIKVAKVCVVDDDVHATVELIFAEPGQFKPVFERAMSLLDTGWQAFASQMRELAPTARA